MDEYRRALLERKKQIRESDIENLHDTLVSDAKTFVTQPVHLSATDIHFVLAAKLTQFDNLLNAYLEQVQKQRYEQRHLYESSAYITDRFSGPTTNGVPNLLYTYRTDLVHWLRRAEATQTGQSAATISFPAFHFNMQGDNLD
jgi:small nuclear ribonucleoprotein (snRNP)-like protein